MRNVYPFPPTKTRLAVQYLCSFYCPLRRNLLKSQDGLMISVSTIYFSMRVVPAPPLPITKKRLTMYCCVPPPLSSVSQPAAPQSAALGQLMIGAALVNSVYSFAWDVKMDWGLCQAGSRRWGLRNTLLISHEDPWPYYAAVAMDLVLRLTWIARLAEGWFPLTDMVLTLELIEVRFLFCFS